MTHVRRTLRRLATVTVATPLLATGVLAVAPVAFEAAAAPPVWCPTTSETLVDFDVLGGYNTKVQTYDVSPTKTAFCVRLAGDLAFQVIVEKEAGASPPHVLRTADTGACSMPIISMSQPVPLAISTEVYVTNRIVCFSLNGSRQTFRVEEGDSSAPPDVEVWTAGSTTLDQKYYCTQEDYWGHYYCSIEPHRVV